MSGKGSGQNCDSMHSSGSAMPHSPLSTGTSGGNTSAGNHLFPIATESQSYPISLQYPVSTLPSHLPPKPHDDLEFERTLLMQRQRQLMVSGPQNNNLQNNATDQMKDNSTILSRNMPNPQQAKQSGLDSLMRECAELSLSGGRPRAMNNKTTLSEMSVAGLHNIPAPQLTPSMWTPMPVDIAASLPTISRCDPAPSCVPFPTWLADEESLPPLYKQFVDSCCPHGHHLPNTALVYQHFLNSGLSRQALGHIWYMVNRSVPGQLTRMELCGALVLIAYAQFGTPVQVLPPSPPSPIPCPRFGDNSQFLPAHPSDPIQPLISSGVKTTPILVECDSAIPHVNSGAVSADNCAENVYTQPVTARIPTMLPIQPELVPIQPTSINSPIGHISKEPSIHSLDLKSGSQIDDVIDEPEDKYAAMKDIMNEQINHVSTSDHLVVWEKLLSVAFDLLEEGVSLLQHISLCKEALQTPHAIRYVQALRQVFFVMSCIRVTSLKTCISSDRAVILLKEGDNCWNRIHSLTSDIIQDVIMPEIGDSPCDSETQCRICLMDTDACLRVEYGRGIYHPQCANLWLNAVDCVLPYLNPINTVSLACVSQSLM